MTERTLLFLKPDSVMQGHIGEIISLLENEGFLITAMKMVQLSDEQAQKFYNEHRCKEFFEKLIRHVTSGPILALVVERPEAVAMAREIVGDTDPSRALPRTIRGKYALNVTENAIHASDSLENARKEVAFFFTEDEIMSYRRL